jgi:hypothetical protein
MPRLSSETSARPASGRQQSRCLSWTVVSAKIHEDGGGGVPVASASIT